MIVGTTWYNPQNIPKHHKIARSDGNPNYGPINPRGFHMFSASNMVIFPRSSSPGHQITPQVAHRHLRERLQRGGPGVPRVVGLDQRVAGHHIQLHGTSFWAMGGRNAGPMSQDVSYVVSRLDLIDLASKCAMRYSKGSWFWDIFLGKAVPHIKTSGFWTRCSPRKICNKSIQTSGCWLAQFRL